MSDSSEAIVRSMFRAYESNDRDLAEKLIANTFSFTSPMDHKLDRDTYFKTCWPDGFIKKFDLELVASIGEKVFVIYNATTTSKKFRNTEVFTVKNNQIAEVEVYFGWDLPHPASLGTHSSHNK